jgi:hypothetical protein
MRYPATDTGATILKIIEPHLIVKSFENTIYQFYSQQNKSVFNITSLVNRQLGLVGTVLIIIWHCTGSFVKFQARVYVITNFTSVTYDHSSNIACNSKIFVYISKLRL